MSANFFLNDPIIQNSKAIKVHSAEVNGNLKLSAQSGTTGLSTNNGVNCDFNGEVDVNALTVQTAITHANIPNANIIQLTSIATPIDATAVANPYNFNVSTFTATLTSGSHTTFFLNMPVGFLNSFGFASISVYYYSNVVGTGGIPVLTIITQENDKVLIMLKNEHNSNALNGNLHFRFKYEKGIVAT
jgi:hypothetical protein